MPATRTRRRALLAALAPAGLALACAAAACAAPITDAPAAAAPAGTAWGQLVPVALTVPPELAAAPFDEPRQVLLPSGWTMSVWARVPKARLAAWAPDGALLVSRPSAGEVVRLVPGPGAPASSVLVRDLEQPHGLAFDGQRLYVAESDQVDVYRYDGATLSDERTVAAGLPDQRSPELGGAYAHALKSVAVGPDKAVYYSIGSTGNISAADRDANPPRAVIMRVPPGGGRPEVYARGVRNGTGLAVAADGAVWTAINHRDDIRYPYDRAFAGTGASDLGKVLPGYVADHPAEQVAKLTPGREIGWPYCDSDPDVDPGAPGTRYRYTTPRYIRDVETNPDGSQLDCAALTPVEQSLGAHSAPLGMSFTDLRGGFGSGALVGVHGSWNRDPPRAPEVSFFPWRDGTLGEQQTLVGGFQAPDGSRWGRPVAAVPGPDGAIYVTDDSAGAVYRLVPPGG